VGRDITFPIRIERTVIPATAGSESRASRRTALTVPDGRAKGWIKVRNPKSASYLRIRDGRSETGSYNFFVLVLVFVGDETTPAARRALLLLVRPFFYYATSIALGTGLHSAAFRSSLIALRCFDWLTRRLRLEWHSYVFNLAALIAGELVFDHYEVVA
jgi:hypothetical protein